MTPVLSSAVKSPNGPRGREGNFDSCLGGHFRTKPQENRFWVERELPAVHNNNNNNKKEKKKKK